MRFLYMVCLCLWLVVPARAGAGDGVYLEQEVIREKSESQPEMKGRQKIWFTENNLRNEVVYGDSLSVAIFDLAGGKVFMIPGPEKQYAEVPLKDYLRMVSLRLRGTGLNDEEAQPAMVQTEQERKIGKWQCRKVTFEQKGRLPIKADLWVTKESGIDFAMWLKIMRNLGLTQVLGRLGGFVDKVDGVPIEVRTEQVVLDRRLVSTSRVTKIEVGPVDPALFQIPQGYDRLEVPPLPPPESVAPKDSPAETDKSD